MKKKSHWNYRIVRIKNSIGKGYMYHIRDIYYKGTKPTSWGADPQYPMGECKGDLFQDICLMEGAIQMPVLELVDGKKLIEVKTKMFSN